MLPPYCAEIDRFGQDVSPVEPVGASGKVNNSKKIARGLVVAGCDSAELLRVW